MAVLHVHTAFVQNMLVPGSRKANCVHLGQTQLCQSVLAVQTCYSATPVLGRSLVGKENYANESDSFLIWKNVRRG